MALVIKARAEPGDTLQEIAHQMSVYCILNNVHMECDWVEVPVDNREYHTIKLYAAQHIKPPTIVERARREMDAYERQRKERQSSQSSTDQENPPVGGDSQTSG